MSDLSKLIVLEKDVEKEFFGYYRKIASLMGVDSYINEQEWDVYKGVIADFMSWAVEMDSNSKFFEQFGCK